ncbi:hypothetical protein C0Q70_09408 [Pomacea canaliculata]|uniref:Solute carrier family 40 member n=1 Tax=Pomacea canaliculata TaxID=400727 RepID=A0A2T7P9R5_POMCA|nr:hypothetical protein C0Q70_09408 [Pomacea canaliculata]
MNSLAAQLSLVLQDAITLVTAALIFAYFWYQQQIDAAEPWLPLLLKIIIVVLGVLSALSAQARLLAVERDWVVEICGKDLDMLATMTAMLRRIDQVSAILAPMATGQVMTFTGLRYGAVLIAGWNVVSVFVEFYLMWKVYNTVPALKAKKHERRILDEPHEKELEDPMKSTFSREDINWNNSQESKTSCSVTERSTTEAEMTKKDGNMREEGEQRWMRAVLVSHFVTLYRGWRKYIRYRVALPGMALACLYLTVLGFDSITIGYAATQGLSESILGILSGCSAVFGIMGTFAYPIIRRRVGLVRTGIIALSCQVSCLTLCVVSVWMPGSPFDPFKQKIMTPCEAMSSLSTTTDSEVTHTFKNLVLTTEAADLNLTAAPSGVDTTVNVTSCGMSASSGPGSYVSVAFLMAGIFLARFGLWVADLSITQLFLEHVEETERGLVNGVQSSLNQLMDLFKFALVVVLPASETFGFLIIISFVSVFTGWLLYAIFVRRETGACLCLSPPSRMQAPDPEQL